MIRTGKKNNVICKQSTLPLKSKGISRPTFGAISWCKCGSGNQLDCGMVEIWWRKFIPPEFLCPVGGS